MGTPPVSDAIRRDVESVARLTSIPTILAAMREVTGLRFGVIARVTKSEWVACAVYDELEFGLHAGDPLAIETTFCSEVHATNKPVVMNDALASEKYCMSPVPKMFGFRSYISVPIFLSDGTNYGTVCALDRDPADVENARVISALSLFGQLIGQQLEAAERAHELQRAHESLKRRNEQLATFASVASHDLRSPLRGIGNLAMWLEEELSDTKSAQSTRDLVKQMSTSVRRMSSLVDGVLEYASAGEDAVRLTDVKLKELVDGISELYAPLNARIVGEGLERVVRVKKVPLQHVITNLVDNGIKHAQRADAQITISFDVIDHELRCSVADNGPGIAAEHHERVWKLFQSLEASSNNERVTGVGLAIVKKLVENEGGRVWIESEAGEGSRFCFTWPLR